MADKGCISSLALACHPSQAPGSLYSGPEADQIFRPYPDEMKGWIPFAVRSIERDADQGKKVDAILSTSPPISSHLIAAKAKTILGCPWVADFRDLWTQNFSNPYP